MGIMIRPVSSGDIPFLWEMLYESIYVPIGMDRPAKDIINSPSLLKYVDGWGKPGDIGFVAWDNGGRPIGSITCRFFETAKRGYGFVDEDTLEMGMAVVEEHRGKGVGNLLLNALLEEAKKQGIKAISLSVDSRNPAMRLYERFGFKALNTEGTSITMKLDL